MEVRGLRTTQKPKPHRYPRSKAKPMDLTNVVEYWEANAENWTRFSRAGYDVYRDTLNTPAFLAMLPPVDGLAGLDIGCGEGTNTRQLARRGARIHAIDIAPTFIRHWASCTSLPTRPHFLSPILRSISPRRSCR